MNHRLCNRNQGLQVTSNWFGLVCLHLCICYSIYFHCILTNCKDSKHLFTLLPPNRVTIPNKNRHTKALQRGKRKMKHK